MSPETSPRPLKRDHDVFEDHSQYTSQFPELEQPFTVPADFLEILEAEQRRKAQPEPAISESKSLPTPPVSIGTKREASPSRSTTGSLTDAGPDTPSYRSQSPMPDAAAAQAPPSSAFVALNGSAPPLAKRTKLTFQEKELKRINKEIRDKERAEEKAKKDAERLAVADEKARKDSEKLAQVAEKAKKDAEKEAEKRKKDAEKEEKRLAQEAEKAAREEKRKQKEELKQKADEEKRKKDEEKRKKERSQMKLNNFFAIPSQPRPRSSSVDSRGRSSTSPAPQSSVASMLTAPAQSPAKLTPSKPKLSTYEKMFPDFFIQNGVTVAPLNRFERDEEGSEAVQSTIDSYILGNRSPGRQRPFDAHSLFHISPHHLVPRGQRKMPVREIMTEFYSGKASRPIDLTTTDSQNSQIKRTTDMLKGIPMKFLHFQEDVRPPYRGTFTARPVNGMAKLARNPLRKDLPETNYDYDSEAEWIEDEDAEDLKSEGDEEEDLDEDEDMEGFLDDEGDDTANSKRLVLQGDLEPVSTGLCWEDKTKRNKNVKMIAYRMEMILDPTLKSIDPFSTSYWEAPRSTSMDPPRIPLNNVRNTSLNFNQTVTKPAQSFFSSASDTLKASPLSTTQPPTQSRIKSKGKTKDGKPLELLPPDKLNAFKREIQGSELTKVGLVEVLKTKFRGHTHATIQATVDAVAKRSRGKNPQWVLLEEPSV